MIVGMIQELAIHLSSEIVIPTVVSQRQTTTTAEVKEPDGWVSFIGLPFNGWVMVQNCDWTKYL